MTTTYAAPDYDPALDLLPDASPGEILDLLVATIHPLGASELLLYLTDFQGLVLQPVLLGTTADAAVAPEEDVASSMAGRAFRTGEVVTAQRDGGARVWVPLVERGERTGVVALTLPEVDDEIVKECVRLGRFAGLLVRSFARTTDLMHLRRRRRTMTLAAGMQWDLLPPLTVRCSQALACGRLEPAYEIAGDAFDYVVNDPYLHAALFDGMGHGVASTMMTTLAVGAYRHSRRAGDSLAGMRTAVDEAMSETYGGQAFVTAAFARLHFETGVFEWTTSGHPRPLLLRDHRIVGQLDCVPSLPLGLGGECREVATENLQPGDCVLFFTDGVVEGRSPAGEDFSVERLVDCWQRQASTRQEPDEVLRRLVEEVTLFNAGRLRDDASLMMVAWTGAPSALGSRAGGAGLPPEPTR